MEALSAFLLPLFLLTLQLTSLTRLRSQAQNLPNEEGEALREIARKLEVRDLDVNKNACNGGWMKAANYRDVRNVICDCSYNSSTICHVKIFVFRGQNLTGILPEELADLPFLEYIDLSRNYLIGSIPARWATLRHLSNLSIMGNRINGTIPKEFGSITTLTELIVEDNQLKGPLPPELGNLSRLESFVASGNQIAGPLPPTFGSLTSLNQFLIDGNSIFGKIPEFIGNWTRITRLDMQGTSMEGPIPSTISNLRNLTELRISDLIIPSVGFPPLHTMPNMRKLVLRNCLTSTEIPEFIGNNMKNLLSLDLSFNNLTGKIPNNFEALSIDHMYLSNNMLTGDIPDWILNSTRQLDISNNNFTGPPSLTNCQRGNVNLVASYSSTGNSSVASCFRKDFPCPKKPQYYSLFINCGGKKLMINKQEYEDDSLDLGPSTFYSTERWAYSSTGDFMDIRNKSYIETNTSVLTTRNPYLYMTARVAPLSLTYYGFCLQNGNYKVQLHFAEIVFTADQTYTSNGRRVFDVLIQGKRLLKDFNIEDEAGGPGRETIQTFYIDVTSNTLEIQLYWAGKGTQAIPYHGVYGPLISAISVTPNFKPDTGDNWLSIGAIIGITVASFASTVLIFIFIWLKGFLGTKNFIDKELRNLELQTGYFSLKQIKVATNNFHPSNKIGEGGFGPVYKGILSDGTEIAVKQLSSTSKQGNREFINEIGMISALQHPNLVKLFGCCVEGDQLLVVYEYMENNSLAHALFGREKHRLKLDWPTRRNICLQIARGLAYLHEESRLKIVHRDIKATNILLDEDLNAKISDFGLAKLDEDENSHISTRIAGTIGYMAPEYAMRGYLTDKADVYSFGVVMLEIISGKSNTTYRSSLDLIYLLDWAYVLQEQGTLLELVDPNLGLDYSEEEAKRMLNLALLCTNASPALRPAMSAVVKMLKGEIELQPSLVKHNSVRDDRSEGFEEYPQESQTKSRSMDWSLLYCSSVSQQNRGGAHFSSSKRLLDDSYTAPKSVSIG